MKIFDKTEKNQDMQGKVKILLFATAQNDYTGKNTVLSKVCEVSPRKSTPILHQVIRSKMIMRE